MEDFGINLLLIIVVVLAVIKMAGGFKRGIIKEIISLVSLAVLCLVAAMIAYGVSCYNDGKFFNVAAMVILLGLLGIAHHLLSLIFFSAKLVSKLPVIHLVDKLAGMAFGALEVVVVLWTVYAFVMMTETGAVGQIILAYTQESPALVWIYEHNYLAHWIERLLDEFNFISLTDFSEIFGFFH